jgi:hypothetical protein
VPSNLEEMIKDFAARKKEIFKKYCVNNNAAENKGNVGNSKNYY